MIALLESQSSDELWQLVQGMPFVCLATGCSEEKREIKVWQKPFDADRVAKGWFASERPPF